MVAWGEGGSQMRRIPITKRGVHRRVGKAAMGKGCLIPLLTGLLIPMVIAVLVVLR